MFNRLANRLPDCIVSDDPRVVACSQEGTAAHSAHGSGP